MCAVFNGPVSLTDTIKLAQATRGKLKDLLTRIINVFFFLLQLFAVICSNFVCLELHPLQTHTPLSQRSQSFAVKEPAPFRHKCSLFSLVLIQCFGPAVQIVVGVVDLPITIFIDT